MNDKLLSEIERNRVLHWNYRMFNALPVEELICSGRSNVEDIYAKENNITFIPEGLHQLKYLKELHLQGNKIAALSTSLQR